MIKDPFQIYTPKNHLLPIALSCAVPLWILSLREKGGPTEEDFSGLKDLSAKLGEKGDILLFGGGKKGEAAQLFNETAKAIAVLSFCPGGIEIFNQHYDGKEFLKAVQGQIKKSRSEIVKEIRKLRQKRTLIK